MLHNFRRLPAIGLRAAELAGPAADEAPFRGVYQRLATLGVTLPPYEQAWADYRRLRADYLPELVAATELLLVPMEFRHHTARLDITR